MLPKTIKILLPKVAQTWTRLTEKLISYSLSTEMLEGRWSKLISEHMIYVISLLFQTKS